VCNACIVWVPAKLILSSPDALKITGVNYDYASLYVAKGRAGIPKRFLPAQKYNSHFDLESHESLTYAALERGREERWIPQVCFRIRLSNNCIRYRWTSTPCMGENRIRLSEPSTSRISYFRDDLKRITESPGGSNFARTRAELGRFFLTLQPCSPTIGGCNYQGFYRGKAACCNPYSSARSRFHLEQRRRIFWEIRKDAKARGKGKATARMAVPCLDNRPRYCTPEVQVSVPQLPTLEPTPAVQTGNRQVSVERNLAAEESVSKPVTRWSGPQWNEILRRIPARPMPSSYR